MKLWKSLLGAFLVWLLGQLMIFYYTFWDAGSLSPHAGLGILLFVATVISIIINFFAFVLPRINI